MSSRLLFLISSFIAAWIMAFSSGSTLVFGISYLLTGVLVISYLLAWLSTRDVSLRRYTRTERGQVGQYVEETFEVLNNSGLPKLWLEVEDYSTMPWHDASRVISSLGHHSRERWQVRTLCTQRGWFRLGPMNLRSGDPLGVFDVESPLDATGSMVVFPLVVDLTSFEPSVSDLSGGEARRQRTYQLTTNVASIRDYAPGDSLNRIHWPTTARTGRLMTKEFELDPTADIWIYMDLYSRAQFGKVGVETRPEVGLFAYKNRASRGANGTNRVSLPPVTTEYCISIAASLARYFLMRDRSVGLSAYSTSREFLQTDRGERQMNKVLETLAVIQAEGKLPFAQVIANDSVRLNRNDTIIAISADPNPDWATALYESQRRGVNSIAVVIDGSTFGSDDDHAEQDLTLNTPADYVDLAEKLATSGISYYIVKEGDSLSDVLSQPVNIDTGRIAR